MDDESALKVCLFTKISLLIVSYASILATVVEKQLYQTNSCIEEFMSKVQSIWLFRFGQERTAPISPRRMHPHILSIWSMEGYFWEFGTLALTVICATLVTCWRGSLVIFPSETEPKEAKYQHRNESKGEQGSISRRANLHFECVGIGVHRRIFKLYNVMGERWSLSGQQSLNVELIQSKRQSPFFYETTSVHGTETSRGLQEFDVIRVWLLYGMLNVMSDWKQVNVRACFRYETEQVARQTRLNWTQEATEGATWVVYRKNRIDFLDRKTERGEEKFCLWRVREEVNFDADYSLVEA